MANPFLACGNGSDSQQTMGQTAQSGQTAQPAQTAPTAQFQNQQMNPMQMMQQLRANPAAFLRQAGLNIPDGMTNPQEMVQHLMQSGQVSQNRFQQARQMMGQMPWKR